MFAGIYGFVFETTSVLWTLTVEMRDAPGGLRTPVSTLNRFELRSAAQLRWARTRSVDVTEATSWSPASREMLKWPAYSLAGRVDTSSRRFTLYSVSRKALFRVDPYAVVASPVRPEVLAYAPAGAAF